VTDVTVFASSLELRDAVVAADRVHDRRTSLFVRAADGDVEAWGECPISSDPTTDATASEVLDALKNMPDGQLAAELAEPRGVQTTEPQRRQSEPDAAFGYRAARELLGAVALDRELRRGGTSLAEYLGVPATDVGFAGVVGIESGAKARDRAVELVAMGASRLRVKVSPTSGADAVRAVLDAVDVPVVADANGSFDPGATHELDALTELPLAWLEQPFAVGSLQQCARLARSSPVRIGLDESVSSLDALRVIAAAGAASVVCVKPGRLGVLGALDVLQVARELRLASYVGGFFEAGLGRAVLGVLSVLGDLDGDVVAPSTYLVSDPCALGGPIEGRQPLHLGPGLGPVPDVGALEVRLERSV